MAWCTPLTLWRFLLAEVLRLLAITTAVVVVVASFAVAVRFIANGTLGPADALRLMALAAIPMLQYALPFAGGFAATLAYHRMSQDNELTALYAGGLSHKAALAPALALGLALAAALFLLADRVMPGLLRSMQQMVADDATRLLQSAVSRGQSIERDGKVIYADAIELLPVEPGSGAYRQFLLRGVVAVDLAPDRTVRKELAAPLARVWLFRQTGGTLDTDTRAWNVQRDSVTSVVMRLRDPTGGLGNRAVAQAQQTEVRFTLPTAFADDPKYLSWAELDDAKQSPQSLNIVDQPRRQLASALAFRETLDTLAQALKEGRPATLTDAAGRTITIHAAALATTRDERGWPLTPALTQTSDPTTPTTNPKHPPATIRVTVQGPSGPPRVHYAQRAWLTRPPTPDTQGVTLGLTLEAVQTTLANSQGQATPPTQETPQQHDQPQSLGTHDTPEATLTQLELASLAPTTDPTGPLTRLSTQALIDAARLRATDQARPDQPLLRWADRVDQAVIDLRREILSKQHERLAASLACLVMVVLGAVMGMKLAAAPPLVVYVWSFLPAVAALVSIAGGQSVTHEHGPAGLLLLYAGVLALALWTFREYRVVARH
jgi:lipopolysaccharide export LptBFGC system permease protein LptF